MIRIVVAIFESTLPADAALMRVSDFQRRQGEHDTRADTLVDVGTTRLAALNPSLMQDLQRFDPSGRPGDGLDALEVMAAALRHGRALLLHLQVDYRVLALTVQPTQRQLLSPLPLDQLLQLKLPALRVLRVEPAPVAITEDDAAPTASDAEPPAQPVRLMPVLWELALRGSRDALLPEIAGVAAYRVAPGADLSALDLSGSLGAAVRRLRQEAASLRDMASWPGFDKGRASRVLNGLYLQAALMVTRTHPAAINGS